MPLSLPPPADGAPTALLDVARAQAWLAAQPHNQSLRLLRALRAEIIGIDASSGEAQLRLDILDALRPAALQAAAAVEIRYAAHPLPLLRDEAAVFEAAWSLWWQLAIAYLRAVPLLPATEMVRPLHRATIALREALRCHYLAAIEAPPELLSLLYEILVTAESMRVQRMPIADPDLPHLGESTVAAEIAWALLLHAVDPYRLSGGQFAVANRAFSRWRDLVGFQAQPASAGETAVSLAKLVGTGPLVASAPAWMEVRMVRRKLRKRIEALQAGETPEALKLGRELSPAACAALLDDLRATLKAGRVMHDYLQADVPSLDLVGGFERLYMLLSGKPFGDSELSLKSGHDRHARIAVFGFDNVANRVDHAGGPRVEAETWATEDDWVLRAAPAGSQMISGTLMGIRSDKPSLVVLEGLRQTSDGWLAGHLRQLPVSMGCGLLRTAPLGAGASSRQPVFFLAADGSGLPPSLLVPTGIGMREGLTLALEDSPVEHLRLGELLERGGNYLRLAYMRC